MSDKRKKQWANIEDFEKCQVLVIKFMKKDINLIYIRWLLVGGAIIDPAGTVHGQAFSFGNPKLNCLFFQSAWEIYSQ